MQLELTLPDDIVVGLRIPPEKIKDEILKEIAFLFYAQGKASMGVARRISGLNKRDFIDELAKRKIPRHYSQKDFQTEKRIPGTAKGKIFLSDDFEQPLDLTCKDIIKQIE
jgi:predicted HTH domain antitoxin